MPYMDPMGYSLGLPPTQDASHHQVDITFLVGNPNLNLHLPLESWVGGQPELIVYYTQPEAYNYYTPEVEAVPKLWCPWNRESLRSHGSSLQDQPRIVWFWTPTVYNYILDGGFKYLYFLFSPLFGEMMQFD